MKANAQIYRERPILMIPGPTEIPWRVIQAMARPSAIQYELDFDREVLDAAVEQLKPIFQTANEIIQLPGSGRVALEASALSVVEPGDRVFVIVAGSFGALMREIMDRAGAQVTEYAVPWGQPIDLTDLEAKVAAIRPKILTVVHNETSTGAAYPVEAVGQITRRHGALFLVDTVSSLAGLDIRSDEWGIDLNMTGSQKCLMSPLGLAVVSVSPRAWEAMEARKRKAVTFSYDLLRWKRQWVPAERGGGWSGGPRRQPVSMPPHLCLALLEAARMINEEGMPARVARHEKAGKALRAGLTALKLDLFPDPSIASDTVSCIRLPDGIEAKGLVIEMRRHGVAITTGIDPMHKTTIRVGHMGVTASPEYILPTLGALEMSLRELGAKVELGASLAAAEEVFSG